MESEAAMMHRALESVWSLLYAQVDGARFERRGDIVFALYPPFRISQCNGPWVVEDTPEAVDALAEAIAEVDAAGARPWVQTRSGHERTQRAAVELGLTYRDLVPGMAVRPDELAAGSGGGRLAIDLISPDEIAPAKEVLAASFGAPIELFHDLAAACAKLDEASWYVGRVDGEIVATALGIPTDDAIGVFNVATLPEHRGRGYGAALTARVARDGFSGGAQFAYLQSSEMGHGVYRKLGFRDVEEYVLFTRSAPA